MTNHIHVQMLILHFCSIERVALELREVRWNAFLEGREFKAACGPYRSRYAVEYDPWSFTAGYTRREDA